MSLLLQVAAGLPDCEESSTRGRVLCVARAAKVDGATLVRLLAREGLPDWPTLDKLEKWTGVPLLRWLVALGRISAADLAGGASAGPPAQPLTDTEWAVIEAMRRMRPAARLWAQGWLQSYPDLLSIAPGAPGDAEPSASAPAQEREPPPPEAP